MGYCTEHHIPDPQLEALFQSNMAKLFATDLEWQLENLRLDKELARKVMLSIEAAVGILQETAELIQPGRPSDVEPADWVERN